jgi:biopolymer transport protein ExbB
MPKLTRKTELTGVQRRCVFLTLSLALVLGAVSLAQESREPTPATETAAAAPAAETVPPKADQPRFKIPSRLDEYIVAGGPLMIPIVLCSFVAIVFGLERLVVLRKRRVLPKDFVTRFIQQLEQGKLDRRTALSLCEENGSPVAQVFEHAVRKWGRPSVEVEQAVIDGGERQVAMLRKHLRILNAVATLGPLLGLLGTVMGMIQTFYEIARSEGTAKASDFAGGIGIAMITTAGGLLVAIPAMTVYMYLIGRVDLLVMEMDAASQKVVNLISAEALAPAAATTPSVRPARARVEPDAEDEPPREVKERRKVVG